MAERYARRNTNSVRTRRVFARASCVIMEAVRAAYLALFQIPYLVLDDGDRLPQRRHVGVVDETIVGRRGTRRLFDLDAGRRRHSIPSASS